ncbi:MAG: hypothetical protein ACLFQJ_02555 [Campylobacterales bacterium]
MQEVEIGGLLRDITDELKSLVEINKTQTEKIIENTRVINSLFNRQMALEKAISTTMKPTEREVFNTIFENSLKERLA